MKRADVVIVGAGGDGPAAAMKLGQAGVDVLVLEAGPWHGNEKWPEPHERSGGTTSGDTSDLSGALLDEQFTRREQEMAGKLRWGPADHERLAWRRSGVITSTVAGVGGTTLHYTGCHPRAYPDAIDDGFPIDYADLVPYYRDVESRLDVTPAPTSHKEELYYQGCRDEFTLNTSKNVTSTGYRPQPNALLRPDDRLHYQSGYDGDFTASDGIEGDTLGGVETVGNPHPIGADYREKGKRSSNIGFVPPALETGNVRIRPNAFVTDVHTETVMGTPQATGVTYRDSWSGGTERVEADVVVLAAGAIETPRLWLNSDLPENEWVGKGMTLHYGDAVIGVWESDELEERLGQPTLAPHQGQNIAARFDMPGVGGLQTFGSAPGTTSIASWGGSRDGFAADNEVPDRKPWDSRGRVIGADLKQKMAAYDRTLGLQAMPDDEPQKRNGVTVQEGNEDEHGPVPNVTYEPSREDLRKRNELMEVAARIFKNAGASHVHRLDATKIGIHIHSTMRMGYVTDAGGEASDVDRLFIADHSVLTNALGGPNPTNTGQALALRTADKIVDRYFTDA